jgi:plasmid stabilization system protein ParE
MPHRLIWSPEAADDLAGISAYISQHSPTIAADFVARMLDAIDRLADFPHLGPAIRDLKRSRYRHLIFRPYRIIYRVTDEAVVLIAIVHGAQDLKRFLRRRRRGS